MKCSPSCNGIQIAKQCQPSSLEKFSLYVIFNIWCKQNPETIFVSILMSLSYITNETKWQERRKIDEKRDETLPLTQSPATLLACGVDERQPEDWIEWDLDGENDESDYINWVNDDWFFNLFIMIIFKHLIIHSESLSFSVLLAKFYNWFAIYFHGY